MIALSKEFILSFKILNTILQGRNYYAYLIGKLRLREDKHFAYDQTAKPIHSIIQYNFPQCTSLRLEFSNCSVILRFDN